MAAVGDARGGRYLPPCTLSAIAHRRSIIGNQARAAGEEFVDSPEKKRKKIYILTCAI